MSLHHISTHPRRAVAQFTAIRGRTPAQLDLSADGRDGAGRLSQVGTRSHSYKAKLAIVAKMRELDRPVTSKELYAELDRAWSLKAIEYHLDTLRKTGIVEILVGPELHFSLLDSRAETKGSTR
jgi:hypothetical protein